MNSTIDKIIAHIKAKPEFELFKKVKDVVPDIGTGGKFYSINNADKDFISIDIRTANFNVMRSYQPALFDNKTTWVEFISQFTSSEFIINCKYLREILFGKLGVVAQLLKLCFIHIDRVMKFIEADMSKCGKVISITNDEVIYEIDKNKLNEDVFIKLKEKIDLNFPNMFHVKCFKLEKLGNKQYFAKRFYFSNNVEFKCCPNKFIMQCIKFYEHKDCDKMDLKFIDEGYVASYDNTIF